MFILPSRGRQHNIYRLMKAYGDTGATAPIWLRLDDDDPNQEYIHENWIVKIGPRCPLSEIYNEAYRLYPNASYYGFIADDVIPKTTGWDVALIDIAGPDGMAVPAGGHDSEGTPHFVLGGELVRSVGWLALPGLNRVYIDTVWAEIAKQRGVLRRCPDITLKHHHFSNRLALFDATYKKSPEIKKQDKIIYETWKRSTHAYLS